MARKRRKRKLEGEKKLTLDWEQENLFSEKIRDEVQSMWEIPQIFHFLYLAKDVLNVPYLSMFEIERMLLMPKASKQLAVIMTSLLSSPMTKLKMKKIPPMPYNFWMNILTHRAKSWFKIYHAKRKDVVRVLEAIGVEPEFWDIFPDESLLDGKDFEELNLKQRVWLLKTVCDTIMHNKKAVQEEIVKQACKNQSDMLLGVDEHGASYVYFPQLIETELRIYRHCTNKLKNSEDTSKLKTGEKVGEGKLRKSRKRKHLWKNGISYRKVPKRDNKSTKRKYENGNGDIQNGAVSLLHEDSDLSTFSSCSLAVNNNHINLNGADDRDRSRGLSKASDESAISNEIKCSIEKSSGYDTSTSSNSHICTGISCFTNDFKGFTKDSKANSKIATIHEILDELNSEISQDSNSNNENNLSKTVNCVLSNFKTDDEKIYEIIGVQKVGSDSKSDDEKICETNSTNDNCEIIDQDKNDKEKEKVEIDVNKGNDENEEEKTMNSVDHLEVNMDQHCASQLETNINPKEWQLKVTAFRRLLKDLSASTFELVVDNVENLRNLISTFSSKNSNLSTNDNNSDPTCDEKLLSNLRKLLSSVEKVEATIKDTIKKAKVKLQKEWTTYKEGGVDNQDSSSEGGLASNWWILGSQGYRMLPSGDATLQALSQAALSRLSPRYKSKKEQEKQQPTGQQSENKKSEDDGQKGANSTNTGEELSTGGKKKAKRRRVRKSENNKKTEHNTEEKEAQPRRSLRTRGVSSYTEDFYYSDEESDERHLDEWPIIEAVDSTSCTQSSISVTHTNTKVGYNNNSRSEKKDSDQDWILSRSRKRKNKRSPPKRLMNLEDPGVNARANNVLKDILTTESVPASELSKTQHTKEVHKKSQTTTASTQKRTKNRTQCISADTTPICKIQSVHSELNIKDEGPVSYALPTLYKNSNSAVNNSGYAVQEENNLVSSNMEQAARNLYYIQTVQSYANPNSHLTLQGQQVNQYHQQYENHSSFNNQPYSLLDMQRSMQNQNRNQNIHVANKNNQLSVQNRHSLPSKPMVKSNVLVEHNVSRSSFENVRNSSLVVQKKQQQLQHQQQQLIPNIERQKLLKQNELQKHRDNYKSVNSNNPGLKTTSLIILSDSDDEIEMIIPREVNPSLENPKNKTDNSATKNNVSRQESTKSVEKDTSIDIPIGRLSPTMIKRMNRSGISIIPLKPSRPTQNTDNNCKIKLVVVVNETGSHYALALPNGSKLILTSEQVAQIRASNDGKLML